LSLEREEARGLAQIAGSLRPPLGAALIVVWSLISYPLGLALGQAWLLPLLNTAPAYVLMVILLRHGKRREAVIAMVVWAASLAVFGTASFALWGEDPGRLVLHGPEYREEMFQWIRTGSGREGSLRAFLPQHLSHVGVFVAASLATGSALSMLMGAVLMNYMAFYVASLARHGVPTTTVILLGWQPYALCRIASFCILGVVLAEPLLSRMLPYPYSGLLGSRRYLWLAATGIGLDWVMKAMLAPRWGALLRSALP